MAEIERPTLDVYIDFSSPYAYVALPELARLAARHGRALVWHPVLLGVIFGVTRAEPMVKVPLKDAYIRHDVPRCAALAGLPFVWPDPFPFAGVAPARAVYWVCSQAPDRVDTVVEALFHEAFGRGQALDDKGTVTDVVAGLGFDADQVRAALDDPVIKDRLKQETDQAIQRGVFGSPFILVDGEPFWGADRLAQLDAWLSGGTARQNLAGEAADRGTE